MKSSGERKEKKIQQYLQQVWNQRGKNATKPHPWEGFVLATGNLLRHNQHLHIYVLYSRFMHFGLARVYSFFFPIYRKMKKLGLLQIQKPRDLKVTRKLEYCFWFIYMHKIHITHIGKSPHTWPSKSAESDLTRHRGRQTELFYQNTQILKG